MALTHRFYRTTRIGTGVRKDPFRSALTRYITSDGTSDFEDWIRDPTDTGTTRYALAICDQAVHTTASADPDVMPLSPQFATQADATAWLDSAFSPGPTVLAAIEGDGIPLDDVTTNRQFFRRLATHHRLGNLLLGTKETVAIQLLRAGLSSTVADLPTAARNRIQSWMTEKAISTAGITGTSTIRDVLKRIAQSGVIAPNEFVRLRNA